MMVGLGETEDEIIETMNDLRKVNCDLLTIGQYLRPSKKHHEIDKFYHPKEFTKFEHIGMELGFKHVAADHSLEALIMQMSNIKLQKNEPLYIIPYSYR